MASTHLRREPFDRDASFVVAKALTIRGLPLAPGEAFSNDLVNPRRLRQLYDTRYIRVGEGKAPPPMPAIDPDSMSDNQLILYLEDNGVVPRFGAKRAWLLEKVRALLGNAEAVEGDGQSGDLRAENPSPSAHRVPRVKRLEA